MRVHTGGEPGALDLKQNLSLLNCIAELGFDRDHTARSERYDGNSAGDIGLNRTRDVQSADGFVRGSGGERK